MLDQTMTARVADAIREAESHTRVEFVAVLARQSDGYYFIPTLWAALLALMLPAVLLITPMWLGVRDFVILQLLAFSVLTALFRLPFLMYRLVPRSVLQRRASNMAHRQFLEQGVHRTADGFGVLFFVSEAEHYVEIIADAGIDALVDQQRWQSIVDAFTGRVRAGDVEGGFLAAVEEVAAIGRAVAPAERAADELPNHLVVIE